MSKQPSDEHFMQLVDLEINTQVEDMVNIFAPSEFDGRLDGLMTDGRNKGAFKPF